MSKNYKQYDTRWSGLGYPKKPHTIGDCGCGEVAICNSIDKSDKWKNETPKTIQPYCKQYAAPNGDGTYINAIPVMMKHYGLTEVKEHQTMNSLWKELKKGSRVAIYLMGSKPGGSKGVHWTSSAHFICSVAYKFEDGLHKIYVKDSNSSSRLRNKWISYEENLKGDVMRCWSGKLPQSPQEKMCAWAKKIAESGDYKYKRYTEDKKTHQCPICHDLKGKYKGWNCIGFAFASWRHGAGIKCKCSCDVFTDATYEEMIKVSYDECKKIAKKRIGIDNISVKRRAGKEIPMDALKKGDIIVYFKGDKYIHTALYLGNGKIADSTSARKPNIEYGVKSYESMTIKLAFRYKGK